MGRSMRPGKGSEVNNRNIFRASTALEACKLKKPCNHGYFLAGSNGFTLIELSVVLALLGILALIIVPNGTGYTQRAREATLKQQLATLRDQLDKYYADNKKYPGSLDELAEKGYLRSLPVDPYTNSSRTWKIAPSDSGESDVYEVHSGSDARGRDGKPVSDW